VSGNPGGQEVSVSVWPSLASVTPDGQQRFSASVSGAVDTSVSWSVVEGSVGGSVAGDGLYTAPSALGTYHVVARSNADPTKSGSATVTVGTGAPGFDLAGGCRAAAIVAPIDGETFVQGATDLRFVGVGEDCNRPTNEPPGRGGSADTLQFLVDGTVAHSMNWDSAEFHYFKGFASPSLAPGNHTVVARAIYTTYPPSQTIDSLPVTITVEATPTYGQTINLASDTTASALASVVGTPSSRIRVNGGGHTISGSAAVDWRYVDFYDVGNRSNTSANGIDITTSGNVTVQNCRFYYTNGFRLSQSGSGTASVRDNVWASSTRNPVGQQPAAYDSDTMPVVTLAGSSGGAKVFAGNNVGAGHVDMSSATNWTVGGTTDADSNVFIGPRVGIYIALAGASNVTIRRNFSQHLYHGGWSQGGNFELGSSVGTSTTVGSYHNVIAGGSWPVRMVGGEFAYNLILMGTEEGSMWLGPSSAVNVHHNVIAGGCNANARSCIGQIYGGAAQVRNNTIDARNQATGGWNPGTALSADSSGTMTATSNAITRIKPTSKPVSAPASLTADYNLFFDAGSAPFYTDSRVPAHDVSADPLFASPASYQYHYVLKDVWQRRTSVSQILADYRSRYTPAPGSPALGTGDPSTYGTGNGIGAIGATGAAAPSDQFGR
jgi:hypothetical protein